MISMMIERKDAYHKQAGIEKNASIDSDLNSIWMRVRILFFMHSDRIPAFLTNCFVKNDSSTAIR